MRSFAGMETSGGMSGLKRGQMVSLPRMKSSSMSVRNGVSSGTHTSPAVGAK